MGLRRKLISGLEMERLSNLSPQQDSTTVFTRTTPERKIRLVKALGHMNTCFVWLQIFNVFNARTEKQTALGFHNLRNRWLRISITG